ncbi:MAG: hypothetical protein QOE06_1294 [Thermoleophilaceae bacterium]|nr:hypothetical protein [Thermoleophilaceae bacterium]
MRSAQADESPTRCAPYDPAVPFARPSSLAVLLVVSAAVAGCGGGGGPLGFSGVGTGKPNATDAAYVRAMVPHERDTGVLAGLGQHRALRKELRRMAKSTAGRQRSDLGQLSAFAAELQSRGVRPGALRLGRGRPRLDPSAVRDATSFDHEFMVALIRQNEGAVAMAEVEQDRGGDLRLKRLAGAILESRSRDLEQLRRWLHTWYGEDTVPGDGGASPSGPGQGAPDPTQPGGGGSTNPSL